MSVHLNDGSGRPACLCTSGDYVTREELARAESVQDDGIVDEIHYVTCETCKKLFREATEAGRKSIHQQQNLVGKAVALETARVWLAQIEDLQEQAREKLAAVATLPPELAKLFDDLEKSAYALLRYLQEFQP